MKWSTNNVINSRLKVIRLDLRSKEQSKRATAPLPPHQTTATIASAPVPPFNLALSPRYEWNCTKDVTNSVTVVSFALLQNQIKTMLQTQVQCVLQS